MKNRDNKIFAEGNYYHIFNHGNGKQSTFVDDKDFIFALSRFRENLHPTLPEGGPLGIPGGAMLAAEAHTPYIRKLLPAGAFTLISYCLMPNHFHLLIRQNTDLPISKLIAKVCTGYSMYFNSKYDKAGNLFQHKFKSVLIDSDSYLMWVSAYIHQNPKVAGLTENLVDYPWSSYPDYIGTRNGTLCDKSLILGMFQNDSVAYQKFVEESFDKIKQRKDLEHILLD